MTRLTCCGALLIIVGFPVAVAAAVEHRLIVNRVDVGHDVRDSLHAVRLDDGKRYVAAVGERSERRLFSFFRTDQRDQLATRPDFVVDVPTNALFYDFAVVANRETSSLLVLTNKNILRWDPQTGNWVEASKVSSIFRQPVNLQLAAMDFARDINGDGLDDLVVPDFDCYRIWLSSDAGFGASEIDIPVAAEMRISEGVPSYRPFPVHVFDANGDSADDFVILRGSQMLAFAQTDEGFSSTPLLIDLGSQVVGNDWASLLAAEDRGQDQSQFRETRLLEIDDVNNDGLVDLLTRTESATGVFKRSIEYGFHFGKIEGNQLAFGDAPDTTVAVDGVANRYELMDVDGDGRKELFSSSIELGVGTVIRALISGSADLDIAFYRLDGNRFPRRPDVRKELSIEFDLGSGIATVPVIGVGDVNGDGLAELVLNDGIKAIDIHYGQSRSLFARRAATTRVNLPRNGRLVSVADADGNGLDDLLIRYDRLGADGEARRQQIAIVMAKPVEVAAAE